jgi:FkbM family methyltransferase
MNPRTHHQLRNLARPILGLLGMRLFYRPSMESVSKHFRALGFQPGTIFDIGVFQGTYELYDTWPDARLILVDPLTESEAAMKHICNHRRAPSSYVVAAAGDHDGNVSFHRSDDLAASSMMHSSGQLRSVPMYTLDTLETMFKTAPPYLLKVDVQGAESLVLSGASRILPLCEVVMLELPLFDFEKTGNTFSVMTALMYSKGFVPFDIYDGMCRPLDSSLGMIDVAFVRIDGRFRQSHLWGTQKQNSRRHALSRLRNLLGL